MKNKYIQTDILLKICFSVMLIINTISAFGEVVSNSWNGEWNGKTPEGDARLTAILNIDSKESLNPHQPDSLCNGFISVFVINPNGNESLLSTYELSLVRQTNNEIEFTFTGGRPEIDEGNGKCTATLNNGQIEFNVTENNGSDALFENVIFTIDGHTVVNQKSQNKNSMTVSEIIISILLSICYVAIFAHMIYLWIRGARYKMQFTSEQMKAARDAEGKPTEMTEEEAAEAFGLLEKAFECWTVVEQDEEGNEFRKPTKMKQIKLSVQYINQVIAQQPTDSDVITRLNELTDIINSNEKRYFYGSKPLIWLGGIVGIISIFLFGGGLGFAILLSTCAYILASRTPTFLIEKRAKRGGSNIHNSMIAGIFAMIAGAKTVRTIYTHADGSKSYEDDHSEHWITLFIGFVALLLIAFLMAFWAFINYLRNYVLYF